MGIFGKRKSREEKAAEIANQIVDGKGFYGRATRAFVSRDDFDRIRQSIGSYNSGVNAQQLLAMGAPTTPAAVVSVSDTGKLVNFDPVVDMVVQPAGVTDQVTLQTIVSKLRIPRPGDQVLLLSDPTRPGGYLYAGMA